MDFKDSKAIYLQIADHITGHILLEKWKPDERIPSVRDLAVALEVNPNTVMRAYDFLQSEAIIFNKRGLGYFVSPEAADKIKALKKKEFIENELPLFFRNVYLLDINMDELKAQYNEFVTQHFSGKSVK